MRQRPVIQAIYNLQMLEQKEDALDTLYQEALLMHRQRQFATAEKKYREFLLWKDTDADAWLNLGILYYEFERYNESIESLLLSIKFASENFLTYYHLGLVFEKLNKIPQAISAYREAIALEPNLDAYNNLGNLLTQTGEFEQAEAIYRQAIAANPSHFGSYLNLGNLLMEQHQIEPAIQAYQTALALKPGEPDILNNLEIALAAQKNPAQSLLIFCNKLYKQGRYEEAIERYQRFLEIQPGDAELYFSLSECFSHLKRVEEAISTLREGIHFHPKAGKLHFYLIKILQLIGRTQEAISSADTASHLLPNEYVFKIFKNLILPIVYDTPDEIKFYRQRFGQGLQDLIQQTSLETLEDKRNALAGIGCITNFYLAYQAHNVLESQSQYGNLVHQIMAANYPKWVEPLSMPPLQSNKIRVGYVSAYLHYYSGTLWLTGWLRYCERQNFEIYCYYTGNEPDSITQQFRDYSDVFHHIPHNLEAVCEQIIADKLHILVFPEIGMDAPTMQIAGLRLAPVQCTAWGHPVTSGLSTIDYYLSSELMEPENAQAHYSEKLILLPNLGVSYPKPPVGQLTKTRSDFQLREDAIIYFCCQAPFKYLLQHDFIFTEIARRVPQAQFVFIRADVIEPRLQRAFAAVNLHSEDYCVFLPLQAYADYLMLNLLSDIYLDSLGFSGGNTTLDTLAGNLPVVTCPGEFMRGRLSYAMLKMIGITQTIASDEAEYIDIAVRLALDPAWRQEIVEKIRARHDNLYDDKTCVKALEAFYKQLVQERLK
jgi:predicted O-linked N-acetylglucosamine transferase (SPINDLY family)